MKRTMIIIAAILIILWAAGFFIYGSQYIIYHLFILGLVTVILMPVLPRKKKKLLNKSQVSPN